ncbi:hypothetical protein ACFSC4_14435 [Deinococcus malanensis]|uniref:hypothetical protein n=1 Tax=Deinococcus malanensis TaxID=1706855 RepID=UPI00362AC8AB
MGQFSFFLLMFHLCVADLRLCTDLLELGNLSGRIGLTDRRRNEFLKLLYLPPDDGTQGVQERTADIFEWSSPYVFKCALNCLA